jgi:WD40 repeat protein
MKLQENGVLQCFIVPMELGNIDVLFYSLEVYELLLMDYFTCSSIRRLFSCGTSKDGDSHLVEWNESEGSIKRTYSGFHKKPSGVVQGVVQFDTAQNHILAVGEDNQIKFWDVDNTNMLTCIEADGGLPVSLCSLLNLPIFSPISNLTSVYSNRAFRG